VTPQPTSPASFGTLVISDGQGTIVIPGCRLDALKTHQDESGVYWTLEIVDRRWRWRELGSLSGCYNQLDPFGKLIPWTIRSPKELATICLEAMGETNYILDFPAGLNYPGPFTSSPIVNITGANPPVNWDGVPPAQALQQLADQYSLRVIYQLAKDRILVSTAGIGGPLPKGSLHRQGPSLKSPETPDSIAVLGAATKYQVRLVFRAVGEDWDHSYRLLDDLSYAPSQKEGGWTTCFPPMFSVDLSGKSTAGVQATDRLTVADALKLAQRSVYKTYQLVNVAGDMSPGIAVPGITGRLLRKEQVILQDTQVDQIVPAANDPGLIDKVTGQPITVNLYNGYSRDKPAAAYGAALLNVNQGVWYKKIAAAVNTRSQDQIFVPFALDPVRYLLTFGDYVFQQVDGKCFPPIVQLQTGIQVRDALTNAPICYFQVLPLGAGAGTNPRVYNHPDVQLNITCSFNSVGMPEAVQILEADPLLRATSYLQAHLLEYLPSGGQILDYNGIIRIDLDGAIQQVTWSVGDDGATTTASVNTEHSPWIPPYPVRRRAEFLPPVLQPRIGAPRVNMPAPGAGPGSDSLFGGGA
jgi:hypothetical protein